MQRLTEIPRRADTLFMARQSSLFGDPTGGRQLGLWGLTGRYLTAWIKHLEASANGGGIHSPGFCSPLTHALHRDGMNTTDIRKYLHDLSNALNAAKINAYLLRRMHGDVLDKETADSLDSSLYDAEKLVSDFHRRVHMEMQSEAASPATKSHA
jgi:hypothetical protein